MLLKYNLKAVIVFVPKKIGEIEWNGLSPEVPLDGLWKDVAQADGNLSRML